MDINWIGELVQHVGSGEHGVVVGALGRRRLEVATEDHHIVVWYRESVVIADQGASKAVL